MKERLRGSWRLLRSHGPLEHYKYHWAECRYRCCAAPSAAALFPAALRLHSRGYSPAGNLSRLVEPVAGGAGDIVGYRVPVTTSDSAPRVAASILVSPRTSDSPQTALPDHNGTSLFDQHPKFDRSR